MNYRTSTHKSQQKLQDLVVDTFKPLSTLETQGNGLETAFHKEIELTKDEFVATRIEEGESAAEALELWLLVEKRRKTQ